MICSMHKHAQKIRKYDRNRRLIIATAITAISIFSFEIIPMATIPRMNAVIQQQQEHIFPQIIINNKPQDEHVIAFSPYIFLFSVSDRKSAKYKDGHTHATIFDSISITTVLSNVYEKSVSNIQQKGESI